MSSRPAAIDALAVDPANAGLILDFDGVLSPIVQDPTMSTLPEQVAESLAQLAQALGLLAVISGRPVEFLADRIRVADVQLLGSYGIEHVRDGVRWMEPEAKMWLTTVREACKALRELVGAVPGVRIEEKSVSVAVHWRNAPDREFAAASVRRATGQVAADTGLQLESGKLVEELRPPIEVDKGTAISSLLAAGNLVTVAYAGDDLVDIPALRAVRQVGGYALVVEHGSETDPQLFQLADQTFAGTDEFAVWLAELVNAIGA